MMCRCDDCVTALELIERGHAQIVSSYHTRDRNVNTRSQRRDVMHDPDFAQLAKELTEWENHLSEQERAALRTEGQLHGDLWYAISAEWCHGVVCFYAGWRAAENGCIDHAKAADEFAESAYDLAEERHLAARDFRKGYVSRCDWADRALVPTVLRREPGTSLALEDGNYVVRR